MTGITFRVHREGAEIVLVTETVVGREPQASAPARTRTAHPSAALTPEQVAARLESSTELVRRMAAAIPAWIEALANSAVRLVVVSKHGGSG